MSGTPPTTILLQANHKTGKHRIRFEINLNVFYHSQNWNENNMPTFNPHINVVTIQYEIYLALQPYSFAQEIFKNTECLLCPIFFLL